MPDSAGQICQITREIEEVNITFDRTVWRGTFERSHFNAEMRLQ